MKTILLPFLIFAQVSTAQVCEPTSAEMKKYNEQKNWAPVSVSDQNIPGTIPGFTDGKNNFFFDNLSRRGNYRAEVIVDKNNENYASFFKYCADWKKRDFNLFMLRKDGPKGKYSVKMSFLPGLNGFSNNPLLDQSMGQFRHELDLKISDSAVIMTADVFKEDTIPNLYKNLKAQLQNQSEFGVIRLDLSGHDDFVCDLIQGNAQIIVKSHAMSLEPKVTQEVKIQPSDIRTLYSAMKQDIPASVSKDELTFHTGFFAGKLVSERTIQEIGVNELYKIASRFSDAGTKTLATLDEASLSCISDQFQNYKRFQQQHTFNLTFKFDPLGVVQQESEKSND